MELELEYVRVRDRPEIGGLLCRGLTGLLGSEPSSYLGAGLRVKRDVDSPRASSDAPLPLAPPALIEVSEANGSACREGPREAPTFDWKTLRSYDEFELFRPSSTPTDVRDMELLCLPEATAPDPTPLLIDPEAVRGA